MAKKWIICTNCRYLSKCSIGQVRMLCFEENAFISSDTGCYDYDEYYNFYNNVQLNLFKATEEIEKVL